VKKSGLVGGGTRFIQFVASMENRNEAALRANGYSLSVTIGRGLPADTSPSGNVAVEPEDKAIRYGKTFIRLLNFICFEFSSGIPRRDLSISIQNLALRYVVFPNLSRRKLSEIRAAI